MTTLPFELPARPRILVITLRRLGDVLMTTPLVRTLRRGFPDATLDMLVFAGSDRILKGNPDIDTIITMPERPSALRSLQTLRKLWRRYDLAVSTQTGDRPTGFALAAGRRQVGLVPRRGEKGFWWKSRILGVPVENDPDGHRVVELHKLATALGLDEQCDVVCPQGSSADGIAPAEPYAVLHAKPMYGYKRWTDAGWRALARGLAERGLAVVATEGRGPEESAYADRVWDSADPAVIRERGRLDWSGLAALLKGAALYAGPDTSVTHLAAAAGCPTLALYGPTSPCLVAPWPVGGVAKPWSPSGLLQRRGNVFMVQNPLPCLPCEALGCDGHVESRSRCMDELTAGQVLAAADEALAWRNAGRRPPAAAPTTGTTTTGTTTIGTTATGTTRPRGGVALQTPV